MSGVLLTQSSGFIIGPIAWLLGKLMNGIFMVLNSIGIQNIGLCIIIFTIIIYTLMLPLTIKQQKFSKMSAVMNPEIQKISKKYKGKKDQESMIKQQEEMQALYAKYGSSPTGGCSTMLIQFPLIFGLFAVIRNIPAYVDGIKAAYMPLVNKILTSEKAISALEKIGSEKPIFLSPEKYDYTQANTIVDVLYKFQGDTWGKLSEAVPSLTELSAKTQESLTHLNSFLGINIAETPMTLFMDAIKTGAVLSILLAVAIPLISGLTQWLNMKLMPQPEVDPDNPMAASMKSMNMTMPLFSVVMCFTMPSGIGLYWIASAVVRSVQQVIVNKHLDSKSVEDMIEENQKKMAKKREKKGVSAQSLNEMALKNARKVQEEQKARISDAERNAKPQNAKKGSLASKANMVRDFNEHNK